MTIGEISLVIKSFQKREEIKAKEILATNYNSAFMIASFVGDILNGKKIPSINELYPNQFPKEEVPVEEDKSWMLYKEQMLDFAAAHNKNRQRKVNKIDD